jgi:hypothetical protein
MSVRIGLNVSPHSTNDSTAAVLLFPMNKYTSAFFVEQVWIVCAPAESVDVIAIGVPSVLPVKYSRKIAIYPNTCADSAT